MKSSFKKMMVVLTGSALALSMGLTALANETAPANGGEQDATSSYGYLAGKAGRADNGTAYAGKYYAGGEQGDVSAYGYLSGTQTNSDRHARFGQLAALTTDEERADFYAANGIGGDGPHSNDTHMDVDALVAPGVIDEDTADAIREYASAKHDAIHSRYASAGDMTPQERHEWYADFDRENGDSVEKLLQSGVITQAQADAIRDFLAE